MVGPPVRRRDRGAWYRDEGRAGGTGRGRTGDGRDGALRHRAAHRAPALRAPRGEPRRRAHRGPRAPRPPPPGDDDRGAARPRRRARRGPDVAAPVDVRRRSDLPAHRASDPRRGRAGVQRRRARGDQHLDVVDPRPDRARGAPGAPRVRVGRRRPGALRGRAGPSPRRRAPADRAGPGGRAGRRAGRARDAAVLGLRDLRPGDRAVVLVAGGHLVAARAALPARAAALRRRAAPDAVPVPPGRPRSSSGSDRSCAPTSCSSRWPPELALAVLEQPRDGRGWLRVGGLGALCVAPAAGYEVFRAGYYGLLGALDGAGQGGRGRASGAGATPTCATPSRPTGCWVPALFLLVAAAAIVGPRLARSEWWARRRRGPVRRPTARRRDPGDPGMGPGRDCGGGAGPVVGGPRDGALRRAGRRGLHARPDVAAGGVLRADAGDGIAGAAAHGPPAAGAADVGAGGRDPRAESTTTASPASGIADERDFYIHLLGTPTR